MILTEPYWTDSITRVSSQVRNNAEFIVMGHNSTKDLMCIEVFAIQRRFDVFLPLLCEAEIALQRHHSWKVLERHFNIPSIYPDARIVSSLSNKTIFSEFMTESGFSDYTPRVYGSQEAVAYPLFVKATSSKWGDGIYLVHNHTQLTDTLSLLSESSVILQMALEGPIEPVIHVLAVDGKLLMTDCLMHSENASLYVTGKNKAENGLKRVSCRDLDVLFPLGDLLRSIVQRTGYNGFGCFNFKYAPYNRSQEELDEILVGIYNQPGLSHHDNLTTIFDPLPDHDVIALPKLYDANTRMCGTQMRGGYGGPEIAVMLRRYLEELASRGDVQ